MQPNGQFPQMPVQPTNGPDYGFIMQDAPTPKKSLLPGNNPLVKLLAIGGGILVLFILLSVVRNIVAPGPDFSGFITVAQDQQSMVHILDDATKQTTMTDSTKEFALIAQLGISNDQQEVLTYLQNNKQKVKPKNLNLKISTQTDNRLAQAATTSPAAYEDAFRTEIKKQLEAYQTDLENTYKDFKGQKGRDLLDQAHTNSSLLLKKLETR